MTVVAPMENSLVDPLTRGCPSGLEPPADPAILDPTPFVISRGPQAHLDLIVFGAKCAGCIAKIERAMADLPGMETARLNLSTGRLTLDWRRGGLAPIEITRRLNRLGYRSAPYTPEKSADAERDEGRRLLRALAVAGFATANVMLLSIAVWSGDGEMGAGTTALLHYLSALIAVPAAAYAGRPFFESAIASLRRGRANMDVPISLAVILALSISIFEFFQGGRHTYFDAAVMLLFFLLIGRYLDFRLRQTARSAARNLVAMQATTATRLTPGGEAEAIAARAIAAGDLVVLAPGDRAPVDGVIVEGSSNVDMAMVNGESQPARLDVGAAIHSGVVNISSRLVMRATKIADESLLAELTRLVEAGEQAKSRYVRMADRAARLYVPVVHSLAFATFAGWTLIAQAGVRVALMNAIAVLIITCPCALGLAAPAVQIVATGRLFRRGVLVKSGDALERLAEADVVVFDKTGTLTEGKPLLANSSDIDAADLSMAAALCRTSRHPLSRAVVAAAGAGVAEPSALETPGEGLQAIIDGEEIRFGSAQFAGARPVEDGRLDAWLSRSGRAPARFLFEDALRADAAATIARLKARGVNVEMLSGDRRSVAEEIAEKAGIGEWRAGLSPQQKIDRLRELQRDGKHTTMIGDGLNDTPALAFAHVSMSPGAAADASQAAADFVYQGGGLTPVAEAFEVSLAARRRMFENFAFAAIYNLIAMPLAVSGHVTPLIAALAMSGSSIVVTLNALRLARNGESR